MGDDATFDTLASNGRGPAPIAGATDRCRTGHGRRGDRELAVDRAGELLAERLCDRAHVDVLELELRRADRTAIEPPRGYGRD